METQNNSFYFRVVVIIFVAGITWWIRGDQKDREYAGRSTHTRDTSTVVRDIPQPPKHEELGPLPAKIPAKARPRIDSTFKAAAAAGMDSLKSLVNYLAAPVDTTIRTDSSGYVRIQYDPVSRMLAADFMPAPRREIERTIVDSSSYPIIEHDSFTTRATIFSAGAAVATIVIALTR